MFKEKKGCLKEKTEIKLKKEGWIHTICMDIAFKGG